MSSLATSTSIQYSTTSRHSSSPIHSSTTGRSCCFFDRDINSSVSDDWLQITILSTETDAAGLDDFFSELPQDLLMMLTLRYLLPSFVKCNDVAKAAVYATGRCLPLHGFSLMSRVIEANISLPAAFPSVEAGRPSGGWKDSNWRMALRFVS
jgi:hypothetical protein